MNAQTIGVTERVSVTIVLIAGLVFSTLTSASDGVVIVDVDSVYGNDSECFSLQELQAAQFHNTTFPDASSNDTDETDRLNITTRPFWPCKTLNRALGNVDCYNSCRYQEANDKPLQNVVVRLMDGVHRLSDCVAIDGGQNVTVEAVNRGRASIECALFPNDVRRDGIRYCRSEGLVFRGVRFERCGHYSPAVFLNRSSTILFEDSVFA